MFKFDEYPEIKKAHEEYQKLFNRMYEIEAEDYKYSEEEFYRLAKEANKKVEAFMLSTYAKAVFDAFSPIKPTLRAVWKKFEPVTWDSIIAKTFEECNESQRTRLFGMVEEEDPYILPAEYYIGKTHVEEYLEKKHKRSNHNTSP